MQQKGNTRVHRNQVFSNFLWRFSERTGAKVISFVVTIVLARMLEPEDYGTLALVTVFISILQVFVDGGFGNALIQKKDADDLDFSTVFYFNVLLCIVLYGVLFAAAPLIAQIYEDPEIMLMIRISGLVLIISGIKNIQQAYISRTMQFKMFFFATLVGTIASAVIGIAMAYRGFGAWALIAQNLSNMLTDTVMLQIIGKWKPHKCFSLKRLGKLFSYGWLLVICNAINTFYENFRQLVIGKMYSASDLACYNKGQKYPYMIVVNVNTSLDSVLFPVMAQTQDEREKLHDIARRAIMVSNYVMAPVMMGLAFMAEPLVSLILTDKWLPCVPFLRIFCIIYTFQPIHTVNLNVIKVTGRSALCLKLQLIAKGIGVILLLLAMKYGVMMIAYAYMVSSFCNQFVNSYPNRKIIGYSWLSQMKDILPSTFLAVFMGMCVYAVSFLNLPILVQVFVQILLGMLIYVLGSAFLRITPFFYLFGIIKDWKQEL